jgi:oligoribonuclease (3'-5' exoribonuclease)
MLPIVLVLAVGALVFAYRDVQATRARRSIVDFLNAPDEKFEVTVSGNSWGADKQFIAEVMAKLEK